MKEIHIPRDDKNSIRAASRKSHIGNTGAAILLAATGLGVGLAGNSLLNHDSGGKYGERTNITGADLASSASGKHSRSVKGLIGKPNSIPNGKNIIVTYGGAKVAKMGGNPNGNPSISELAAAVIASTAGYGTNAATDKNVYEVTIEGDKAINEYYTADPNGVGFVEEGTSNEFEVTHGTDVAKVNKILLTKADMSAVEVVAPPK